MADIKLRDADNDQIYAADDVEVIFGSGTDINDASEGDWSVKWDATNTRLALTSAGSGEIYMAPASTAHKAIRIGIQAAEVWPVPGSHMG